MNDDEITLSEMLEDPIFHQLLASDHISISEFRNFIALEIDRHSETMAQREIDLERAHHAQLTPILPMRLEVVSSKVDELQLPSSWPASIV